MSVVHFTDSRRKGEREQFLKLVEAQRQGHTGDIVPREIDFSVMAEEFAKDGNAVKQK